MVPFYNISCMCNNSGLVIKESKKCLHTLKIISPWISLSQTKFGNVQEKIICPMVTDFFGNLVQQSSGIRKAYLKVIRHPRHITTTRNERCPTCTWVQLMDVFFYLYSIRKWYYIIGQRKVFNFLSISFFSHIFQLNTQHTSIIAWFLY